MAEALNVLKGNVGALRDEARSLRSRLEERFGVGLQSEFYQLRLNLDAVEEAVKFLEKGGTNEDQEAFGRDW